MVDEQQISKMRSSRKIQVMINAKENERGCHLLRFYPKGCNCERCKDLMEEVRLLKARLEIINARFGRDW